MGARVLEQRRDVVLTSYHLPQGTQPGQVILWVFVYIWKHMLVSEQALNSEYLIQALNENEAAHPREERSCGLHVLGVTVQAL